MANNNYRSRPVLDLAYAFDCYLRFPGICTGGTGEPAHSNQSKHGKGGAMKAHDCYHVPGCRACHAHLDQGGGLTRDERREAWENAFWEYLPEMFRLLKVK